MVGRKVVVATVLFLSIAMLSGGLIGLVPPVRAEPIRVLGIDTGSSWDYNIVTALSGVAFTEVSTSDFATTDLNLYDVLFISETFSDAFLITPSQTTLDSLKARESDLASWINAGHGVVALAEPTGSGRFDWLPDAIQPAVGPNINDDRVTIVTSLHPVMSGLTTEGLSGWASSSHGNFVTSGGLEVLANNGAARPITLATVFGLGGVVITDQDPDFHLTFNPVANKQYAQFVQNAIDWAMPTTIKIATFRFEDGIVGESGSDQIQVVAGVPPYTFTLLSGSVPTGMSLSSTGLLSETPSAVGTFVFAIQVVDSTGQGTTGTITKRIATMRVLDYHGNIVPSSFLLDQLAQENSWSVSHVSPAAFASMTEGQIRAFDVLFVVSGAASDNSCGSFQWGGVPDYSGLLGNANIRSATSDGRKVITGMDPDWHATFDAGVVTVTRRFLTNAIGWVGSGASTGYVILSDGLACSQWWTSPSSFLSPLLTTPGVTVIYGDYLDAQILDMTHPVAQGLPNTIRISSHHTRISGSLPGFTVLMTDPATGLSATLVSESIDFAVSSSPSSRTIGQGQATSYDVMTTLVAGTAQPVSLTVSGLPSGATASFTPATITPSGISTLFVTTTTTTPSGSFPLTINGSGGGVTKSVTVDLTIAPVTVESFISDATFSSIGSFDVVFTPDHSTGTLKLAATTPGTYFYNTIVRNTGSSALGVTITLDIPSSTNPALAQAFLLKSSNPTRIYADLARTIDVTGTATITPQQPLTSPATSVSAVSVSLQVPAGELRYVTVFLEFGGKGSTGFASDSGTTYHQGFKFKETLSMTGILGTVEDLTSFTGVGKRVTAIGGFVLDTNLNYKSALRVRVFSGATNVGESPVTAPDGFYFAPISAGGPYSVELFNPTTATIIRTAPVQTIAVNEYMSVDFLNLNPADPVIEGFVFDGATRGVSGATIELYGPGGRLQASTVTTSSGWYAFRFTQPGKYTVRFLAPQGYATGVTEARLSIRQFETLRVDFAALA